ncbi:MAG: alpha-L-fucosidase, partial [Bacteroidales bacterium]|nr:alpha-L-fucosidase [Bacteroidales bacterium]
MKTSLTILSLALLFTIGLSAQNKPEREKWLQDAGFGMFIHWSMDVQLGTVISHSLVGASEEYADRYINELPETFNPYHYDPERIAYLARMAGMKYMVFTTKHHSGFCMWDTETSDFSIMNTPYSKDIVRQYVDACRKHGLAVGFYFSPEDFHFLYTEDQIIRRRNIEDIPEETKTKYIALVKAQCSELLSNYGKVDMMFFDGGGNFLVEPLKAFCWEIQPD